MEKRLKTYLLYLQEQLSKNLSSEEMCKLRENLLIQIGFFQHERLIHLLVTITFALLAIATLFFSFSYDSLISHLLFVLFLVLLVPYIRHYYILENGVQKLYKYYDYFKA